MGILSNIFRKIFPSSHPAVQSPKPATPAPSMQSTQVAQAAPAPQRTAPPPVAPMEQVDVEAILNGMPQASSLNWRTSIVDLLKLLNLDSDLASRKELAAELDYKGDTSDSATMNIWLHRQVMNKLAANGGKVPADLRD
ncbi:DUF3597 domain-containing protein [Massilia sp. PAMC28688]|uniref:DUF3597 domain-containing protein n=1 Tax=Massilia sp. PAMC28688 TaxID=2861283 RepID=UPI001C62AF9A|nr:DUF3597 domain-containing protein [Massilia sp. PAMC28688]QYF94142.1 DUF3597 domain-containing protein [Massilia sp. PAMC28688]